MLPKAILFDLDDTILSFDGAADSAWEECCNSFVSGTETAFDAQTLLESINKVRRWYWGDPERHRTGRMDLIKARRDIVLMAFSGLKCFDAAGAHGLADRYSRLQDERICLFPDAVTTLERLKASGTRLALVTNGSSETQRGKLRRFGLTGFFEVCLIEGETGVGKPDPGVFEIALEKLGLKAGDAWMVGDNLVWDVEAPQKVGIYAVWNDYGRKGLPENSSITPDRIIHSISELLE